MGSYSCGDTGCVRSHGLKFHGVVGDDSSGGTSTSNYSLITATTNVIQSRISVCVGGL